MASSRRIQQKLPRVKYTDNSNGKRATAKTNTARGRGGRSAWYLRNPNAVCEACGGEGHLEPSCWIAHPEKKPKHLVKRDGPARQNESLNKISNGKQENVGSDEDATAVALKIEETGEEMTQGAEEAQGTNDAGEAKPKLETLAEEIIEMIMSRMLVDALTVSRLVNKKLARIGRRFLCRNVNVTEVSESLGRLQEISQQDEEVRRSVKHLTYLPFNVHRIVKLPEDYVGREFHGLHRDEYRKLVRDRRHIAENSLHIVRLSSALEKLRPKSISICPQLQPTLKYNEGIWSKGVGSVTRFRPSHPPRPDFTEVVHCTHKVFNELERRRTIDSGVHEIWRTCNTRSFLAILHALHESKSKLKCFEAAVSLSFLAWPSTLAVPRSGLENLEVFKLKITEAFEGLAGEEDLNPKSGRRWDSCSQSRAIIVAWRQWFQASPIPSSAEFFAAAPLLKELELEFEGIVDFKWQTKSRLGLWRRENEIDILGQNCWQHLETFRLSSARCKANALLDFIMRHKALRHLDLTDIELSGTKGNFPTWYSFLTALRAGMCSGKLKLLSLNLGGNFSRDYKEISGCPGFFHVEHLKLEETDKGRLLSEWILNTGSQYSALTCQYIVNWRPYDCSGRPSIPTLKYLLLEKYSHLWARYYLAQRRDAR